MTDHGADTYGERWAEIYDAWSAELPLDTDGAVEFLAGLAGRGSVLELAIGTGRVALPLTLRGIDVHGIDASAAMIAKLKGKPGGSDISVTVGDFSDVDVEGKFRVVFIAFNTFFALLTQEDQLRCFRNVSEHLEDGGVFVIEAFVPDLTRFDAGQRVEASKATVDESLVTLSTHDAATQRISTNVVRIGDGRIEQFPIEIRYAYPSELDLMAQLAGLHLRDRWGGWRREPFTALSQSHISVFER
jgi:SAM-dependent methyltransferase